MEKLEKMKGDLNKVSFEEPAEAHLPRGEYIRLMGDLVIVTLQMGLKVDRFADSTGTVIQLLRNQ